MNQFHNINFRSKFEQTYKNNPIVRGFGNLILLIGTEGSDS